MSPPPRAKRPGAYADGGVSLRANEAAVTIVIEHEEPLSLSGRGRQSGHSLRHRRWASGLSMVGRAKDLGQGGVTRLAAAARDDRPSALSAAVHGGGEGNPLDARALYSAQPSFASIAQMSRRLSAAPFLQVAFDSSTTTWSISTPGCRSARRSYQAGRRPLKLARLREPAARPAVRRPVRVSNEACMALSVAPPCARARN